MRYEELIENNKLMSEFMGYTPNEYGVYQTPRGKYHLDHFSFHSSWDWLMPVVEKIGTIPSYDRDKFDTEVIIYRGRTDIKSLGYGEKEHSYYFFNKSIRGKYNSTEHTYKAVLEYIKWYNKKNRTDGTIK